MRGIHVVMVIVAAGLAGCFSGVDPADDRDDGGPVDWAAIERQPYLDVTFPATTRAGVPVDVAGYLWMPEEPAEAVVLAVHGDGGLALDIFGPAAVPGYSFAHRVTESGRAVVAIVRPGYGGLEPLGTQDEHAFVMAQVAERLRDGSYAVADASPPAFDAVVAAGHSMGAYHTMISQGEYAAFDGIVPIGWSHGGYRDRWWECLRPGETPGFDVDCVLVKNNADPAILECVLEVAERVETNPDDSLPAWIANTGSWRSFHPALRDAPAPDRDELSATKIESPVLMLLGTEDGIAEPSTQEDEEAVFTSTEDLTVIHFEETAHWVFQHLNREEVYGTIFEWLNARGL